MLAFYRISKNTFDEHRLSIITSYVTTLVIMFDWDRGYICCCPIKALVAASDRVSDDDLLFWQYFFFRISYGESLFW